MSDASRLVPEPGQVVTVFRNRLRPDAHAYPDHVARISALARTMPGYVEHKTFTAEDGERVTVVTFADRPSHEAWARHPEHREAQRAGVRDYYEEYSISVGVVDRASHWSRTAGRRALPDGPGRDEWERGHRGVKRASPLPCRQVCWVLGDFYRPSGLDDCQAFA